jgi:cytoplasmic tRNA 2-thiolation protein 1
MAPKSCGLCQNAKAILRRPKTGQQICKDCFFKVFETEVHNTITESQLFKPGDRVAIGASGGKGMCVFLSSPRAIVLFTVSLSGGRI